MQARHSTVQIGLVSLLLCSAACAGNTPATEQPPGDGSGGSSGNGGRGGNGSSNGGQSGGGQGGSGGQSGGGGSKAGGSTGSNGGSGPGTTGGTSGGDGGPAADMGPAACTGPNLPAGNRCMTVTKAMGNAPLIDDFEAGPDHNAVCNRIREVDGRQGSWNSGKDGASPMGSVVHTFEAPGDGSAPGSKQALHIVGTGLNGYGGFLATPLAPCYDASAYKGISFWVKGDPSKAPEIKISFATPFTAIGDEGGTCVPGAKECYDHASVHLLKVSNTWTRYAITWQQLAQFGWGQMIPGNARAEAQIIGVNFSPIWANDKLPNKAFDFWIDDVTFDVDGKYSDTGFKSIVTKATFDAAFTANRGGAAVHTLYANAYNDLAEALDDPRFSRVGREGSLDDRKREIAAFMAHVVQETNALQYSTEVTPQGIYCNPAYTKYPCAAGKGYIGRGPMQLTWNYNYGPAGEYFGLGNALLTNPERVATEGPLAWKTALFFWMGWRDKDSNALLVGPHYRFLKEGFGASIRAVNGALECPSTPMADRRRTVFQDFCTRLGVGNCNQNLACPAQ